MIETVLVKHNASQKVKIAVKSLIAALIVTLAVVLPQLVHIAAGQSGGVKWLPMYLPVLLGGCLLGFKWGLAVGLLSPLASFVVTSAFSSPMPALARLPFMMLELAVFAAVSGAFSEKISKNGLWAFPAVILAEICGRGIFMLAVVIFQAVTPFTPAVIWAQIKTGLLALGLQAVIVPVIVIILRAALNGDKND